MYPGAKVRVIALNYGMHDNKTRWWHIVSGDEGDLDKLEGEWEAVRLQMGWKLEKYFVDGNFLRNGDSPPT